jgi:hypothetical protein
MLGRAGGRPLRYALKLLLIGALVTLAGSSTRAQERTELGAPAQMKVYIETQKRFVEDIEKFAAEHAAKDSPEYWAIIEHNLHYFGGFEPKRGERRFDAPLATNSGAVPAPPLNASHEAEIAAYFAELKDGSRIFGGRPAPLGQFDEVVSLARPVCETQSGTYNCTPAEVAAGKAKLSGFDSFCSGTLVAEDTVLTAAHCLCSDDTPIDTMSVVVVFGGDIRSLTGVKAAYKIDEAHIKAADDSKNVTSAEHAQLCANAHANGDGRWSGRDVAMVTLQRERLTAGQSGRIGTDENHKPPLAAIAAPSLLFGFGKPSARQEVVLAGFGKTEANVVGVKYFATAEIRDYVCSAPNASWCSAGKELLAVGGAPKQATARVDSCAGDSGGPVFLLDGANQRYLIASTSRGAGLEMKSAFGPYGCGIGGTYSLVSPRVIRWLNIANEKSLRICSAPGACVTLK